MLDFAAHEFELSKADQNGTTLRQHLEQVERQTKKRPKELEGPKFPTQLSHIWSAFLSLNSARQSGMSGPQTIAYSEIMAWVELTGTPLSPLDVEIVKKLDHLFLKVYNG